MDASGNQKSWAIDSWRIVLERYRQWSTDDAVDYSPLISLIESIRAPTRENALSLGTSLMHLVIAPSHGVLAPNQLDSNAPRICITQLEHGFRFTYAPNGRSGHTYLRESEFKDGSPVLDALLLRLDLRPLDS
jgi:hypothetical protein